MRKEGSHIAVAKKEWMKEKREKRLYYVIISIFLLSIFVFLFFLSLHLIKMSGYASIISKGGYITQVELTSKFPTQYWGGFYGLVLRVPGFYQQMSEDLMFGTIERADVFFDCIQKDSLGGPEVYASTNPYLDLTNVAEISPATTDMIDDFINCSGREYCATNTFTRNKSIYVGSTEISNVPSTFTYRYDGENEIFDISALNISGSLAFVASINSSIQKGFNPNYLVNYQMLLPIPPNTTQTYYFYTDPFDVCPSGGIGNTINATVYGFIFDSNGSVLENATISVAGQSTLSDANGFYNLSVEVLEGTYNFVVQKTEYKTHISNLSINFSNYVVQKNATLEKEEIVAPINIITLRIFGYVKDTGGNTIAGANISMGNASIYSDISGYYSFYPSVVLGTNPLVAFKEDYDNYYALINVSSTTTEINHNITMEPANLNPYITGPYAQYGVDMTIGDVTEVKEVAEEMGQDYWISTTEINKQVRENTFIEDKIGIYNFKGESMRVVFGIAGEVEDIIKLDKSIMNIAPSSFDILTLTIYGTKPIGIYTGTLKIGGDLNAEIPIIIEIVPKKMPIETLGMDIELFKERIESGEDLRYRLHLKNLLTEQMYKIQLRHLVLDGNGSTIFVEENEEVEIQNSLSLLRTIKLPKNLSEGDYILKVEARYLGLYSSVGAPFVIYRPLYLYSFFGIPLWIIFIIISFLSFVVLNLFLYKRHLEKKKRYHLNLYLETLPKPGERAIKVGKIAERDVSAYYNIDDFTTHAIIAGATGGGKSICAQVFVEEILMKNIAVIVFDPTAQWSGMLRKCEDKKMLSFYPKFKLKQSDARAFPGNVKQMTNHLESIDINKYMNPGQIQIFTLNKLEPAQIDIFVAGVISNIFKSDPKEFPNLRLLLVFDEVHRLLPKFGGSGKGFLQIERACREFRKWGFGVLLVSQVLSDFVGEIKANINTEIQMRVAEENDLERIKARYGLDALKSLVRADVGTGMIQNAEYNRGLPYFINFRPILHNTRRLPDEILDKYNKYNEVIEEIEDQINQLEKEKVDTFDLKMELKLVKDKLMVGNFTVVDIYLDGLKPRIEKVWESIGKKPKKREAKLIDVKELESSLAIAEKEREKWKDKETEKERKEVSEKIVDIGEKIVAPLTFDNGIMVSSLNELKDVLPNLDNSVFKVHVNEEKNDVADWVKKQIEEGLGKKLREVKDKKAMVNILNSFREGKKEEKGKKSDEGGKKEVGK